MTNEHAVELCRRWQEDRDEAAITELVNGHRAAARRVAIRLSYWRTLPAWVGLDDLEAIGLATVIEAAAAYRSDAGMTFLTYLFLCATHRIVGRQLGPLDRLKRRAVTVSLDAPVTEDGHTLAEIVAAPAGDDPFEQHDRRAVLAEGARKLPEVDRAILTALYGYGLTLEETAKALGLSQQRVYQRRQKSLGRMRKAIGLASVFGLCFPRPKVSEPGT